MFTQSVRISAGTSNRPFRSEPNSCFGFIRPSFSFFVSGALAYQVFPGCRSLFKAQLQCYEQKSDAAATRLKRCFMGDGAWFFLSVT
jgi:hypothetical protein